MIVSTDYSIKRKAHMNVQKKTALALACLSLIPAVIPITAMAQNWEMTSGLPTQQEVYRGTKEIRVCASPGGSISVGTTTPGGAAPTARSSPRPSDPRASSGAR